MDHGDYDWATVLNTVTEQLHDDQVPSSNGRQSPEAIQYSTPEAQLECYPHLGGHIVATDLQLYTFGLHRQMLRAEQGSANIFYNGPDNI